MNKYSDELVQRIIKYFKVKYNLDITKEKANEYLSSLADFFSRLFK